MTEATATTPQTEPRAPPVKRAPTRGRVERGIRIGLAALFFFAGIAKLADMEMMRQVFEQFGYSADFMLVIGVLETAGAVGLLIPPLAFWAALGLCGIMIGAVVSHVAYDAAYMALPAVVVFCLLGWTAWRRRRTALPPT